MHALTVSHTSASPRATLYHAFTGGWGAWFGEPATARLRAEVGEPFCFDVVERFGDGRDDVRHPHYGRFLRLEPDTLVSLTWMTSGTGGAETTLTVTLDAIAGDTSRITLTHAGFATPEARDAHEATWPTILAGLDTAMHGQPSAASAPPALRNRSMPDATFIPVRSYPDMDTAVTWLVDVLGARERLRVPAHRVQLVVGDGAMVVAAWDPATAPASGGRPPAVLMVRVPDVQHAYDRALALGATALAPPADHAFGERQASVRDPAGHAWTLTESIADVDPAAWGGEIPEA